MSSRPWFVAAAPCHSQTGPPPRRNKAGQFRSARMTLPEQQRHLISRVQAAPLAGRFGLIESVGGRSDERARLDGLKTHGFAQDFVFRELARMNVTHYR